MGHPEDVDLTPRVKDLEQAVEEAEARIAVLEDALIELAKKLGYTIEL